MPRPGRAALIVLAALALPLGLGLSGCDNKKARTAELIAADKAVAAPPTPLVFAQDTPDAKVKLTLQPGLDNFEELHKALFDRGRQEMVDFTSRAKEDRAHLAAKGRPEPQPYQRTSSWTVTAISPHLISLRNDWFADTGGAHPNHGTETRFWDRARNQWVMQAELFKPGYDFARLDAVLCEALTKTKTARMGPTDPKSWVCPKWADSHAVLIPSTRKYRMGGMIFLFDPYVIGAYAEGDYEALIPLSAFQDALAQPWAQDFTGSPSPAVKPRP